MENNDRNGGIYTPRELGEMCDRLDRESLPGETHLDREARATAILREKRNEVAGRCAGPAFGQF